MQLSAFMVSLFRTRPLTFLNTRDVNLKRGPHGVHFISRNLKGEGALSEKVHLTAKANGRLSHETDAVQEAQSSIDADLFRRTRSNPSHSSLSWTRSLSLDVCVRRVTFREKQNEELMSGLLMLEIDGPSREETLLTTFCSFLPDRCSSCLPGGPSAGGCGEFGFLTKSEEELEHE